MQAAKPRSRLREWAGNAAALLLALGVVYAGAEAYVSLFVDDGMQFDLEMWRYTKSIKRVSANPAIGHEHTPNTHAHLMGVDVDISSQGLRDREFTPTPPPGRTRILMLGDSLTLGWGVPIDKTYSKRVEAMLRAAGHDVEVMNSGVGNWNTQMEVAYFLERGLKFKPDYVVLNYFINDPEPTPHYGSHFLAEHSRALVYFTSRIDMALREAHIGNHPDWEHYYAALYGPEGRRRVATAVEQLAAACRSHGIKLYIANQPELRDPGHYAFPYVDKFVAQLAAENHVAYIPLLPTVRELEPSTLWVTPPDPHPSIAAHEAFAKGLFRVLDAELTRAEASGKADRRSEKGAPHV